MLLTAFLFSVVCLGAAVFEACPAEAYDQQSAYYDRDPFPSTKPELAREYRPPILIRSGRKLRFEQYEYTETEEEQQAVYSDSVLKALKYMKLTPEHLNTWIDKRENTALKKLSELPDDQQRRIARIAAYIRRCNGSLSSENIWREACAIYFYAVQYSLSPELVAAVAKAESDYDPNCKSRYGALGVMQVIYRIHKAALGRHNIATEKEHMFDPERGIHAGVFVLKGYLSSSGSVYKGLMRYLGGHSNRYYMRVQNTMTKIRTNGEKLGL